MNAERSLLRCPVLCMPCQSLMLTASSRCYQRLDEEVLDTFCVTLPRTMRQPPPFCLCETSPAVIVSVNWCCDVVACHVRTCSYRLRAGRMASGSRKCAEEGHEAPTIVTVPSNTSHEHCSIPESGIETVQSGRVCCVAHAQCSCTQLQAFGGEAFAAAHPRESWDG